jgi:7,8-dihydropterin-6-yl-methyl-4-(beta-D-ribofuranosyl)aminobenzene 5'-phosphate synthase
VLGCAHAGVVNIVAYAAELMDHAPIRAVIGGTHLGSASRKRIQWTISELRRRNVGQVVPAHCTGAAAQAAMLHALPDCCVACEVGARYVWDA